MLKTLKNLQLVRHYPLAFILFVLGIMSISRSSYGEMHVYGDSISYTIEIGDTTFLTLYNATNLVISQSDSTTVLTCSLNGVNFVPSIEAGRILYGFSPFDSLKVSFLGYGFFTMWGNNFFAFDMSIGKPKYVKWIE